MYFIDARRIRLVTRNGVSGNQEKKEVTVHVECIK